MDSGTCRLGCLEQPSAALLRLFRLTSQTTLRKAKYPPSYTRHPYIDLSLQRPLVPLSSHTDYRPKLSAEQLHLTMVCVLPTALEGQPRHPSQLGPTTATISMETDILPQYRPIPSPKNRFLSSKKQFSLFVGYRRAADSSSPLTSACRTKTGDGKLKNHPDASGEKTGLRDLNLVYGSCTIDRNGCD